MSRGFDLEKAVAAWRHVYARRRVFLKEDLDELEQHLRDHTLDLVNRGVDEAAAFRAAVEAVGDIDGGSDEYGKVYWAKLRRTRGAVGDEVRRQLGLFANDLKLAVRQLMRRKGYAAIHVSGLAVGLACFLVMALYVSYEWSYDRHFPDSNRIFRVTLKEESDDRTVRRAVTPPALAPALVRDIRGIGQAIRIGVSDGTVVAKGRRFSDVRFGRGDSAFFDVFAFPFIAGDGRRALRTPNGAVLTRSTALKLFGRFDVVGERIETPELRFADAVTVTGVIEDIPANTHFAFDLIVPRATVLPPNVGSAGDDQWWLYGDYTYARLAENASAAVVARQLPLLSERYLSDRPGISIQFHLQPVTSIHLYSHLDKEFQPNGRAAYVFLLGGIGLLVLLLACINFINLATARAIRRAREVGVRKSVGAGKGRLIGQFLTESTLLVAVATVIAIGLMLLGVLLLEDLANVSLPVREAVFGWMLPGLPLLMLIVGLLAGSYPAFVLSGYRPSAVLKPGRQGAAPRGAVIRKGLVIAQFACSIALLIGTGAVYEQVAFMQQADPGFDKEHVVVVQVPDAVRETYDPETIRQAFLRHSGIRELGFSRFVPTENIFANGSPIPEGSDREVPVYWHNIDAGYMDALGLRLVAGRDFSTTSAADTAGNYGVFVVNEAAVRQFGWSEPIGMALLNPFNREPLGRVIGVVADFHMTSLQEEIAPLVYFLNGDGRSFRRIIVRLEPGHAAGALAFMGDEWAELVPDQPFSHFFLDDSYAAQYVAEVRLNRIVGIFAALAVFVACLGLLGLAAFAAEQRTKEIGVRKVLGATVADILALLSREFIALIAAAFVLGGGMAYYAVQQWLDRFAYRIEMEPGVFVLSGLLVLVVAIIAVCYQSARAALSDPVMSLRYE